MHIPCCAPYKKSESDCDDCGKPLISVCFRDLVSAIYKRCKLNMRRGDRDL